MMNPTDTPRSGAAYTTSIIAVTINDQGLQSVSLVDPLQLFNAGYASHDGNFFSLTPDGGSHDGNFISLAPDRAAAGAMLGMAAAGKRGAEWALRKWVITFMQRVLAAAAPLALESMHY